MPQPTNIQTLLLEDVSFHRYNDNSGCSFYNHNTGVTVSIQVGADLVLEYYLTLSSQILASKDIYVFLNHLIRDRFISAPIELASR